MVFDVCDDTSECVGKLELGSVGYLFTPNRCARSSLLLGEVTHGEPGNRVQWMAPWILILIHSSLERGAHWPISQMSVPNPGCHLEPLGFLTSPAWPVPHPLLRTEARHSCAHVHPILLQLFHSEQRAWATHTQPWCVFRGCPCVSSLFCNSRTTWRPDAFPTRGC